VVLRIRDGKLVSSGAPRLAASAQKARFEDLFGFQLAAEKAPAVERQFRFAAELGRQFRWDFAWPDRKLAVEIQGGIWKRGGGAHSHPTDILRNMRKYNAGTALGWRLLQFSTDEVKSGSALQYTMTVLRGGVPNPL
jgi:very-short-patch-repair endonuclease